LKDLIAMVGALGIGGLITSYFTMLWNQRKNVSEKHHEMKDKRYKCIILLMQASLDFDKYKSILHSQGYGYLSSESDLVDLLNDEYVNSFLFASDEFIHCMSKFIRSRTHENLVKSALSMRKDLYGVKTKLTLEQVLRNA